MVWVVAASFAAIGLFSYLPLVVPFLQEYASAFIAAAFIYLPAFALWHRRESLALIGVKPGPVAAWPMLLLVMAIVFPLFSAGFHLYQRLFFDSKACFEMDRISSWPETFYHSGLSDLRPGLVLLKDDRDDLLLINNGESAAALKGTWSGGDATLVRCRITSDGRLRKLALIEDRGFAVYVPGEALLVRAPVAGTEVKFFSSGPASVLVGNYDDTGLPHAVTRGYGWLLTFLLIQFLLIALPEEIFYRGYLQTRLQMRFGRFPLFGGDIGPAVWVTSALFALGHLIAIPSAGRLAVFFPSLLFGWLRDRTGSVVAPIVLHALSNVLLALLNRTLCS